jgi:hypothetical protein
MWLVSKDDILIGSNILTLKDRNQNQKTRGSRTDSWTFLSPGLGKYNFTAYVLAITGQQPPNSHVLHKTISFTTDDMSQQQRRQHSAMGEITDLPQTFVPGTVAKLFEGAKKLAIPMDDHLTIYGLLLDFP